MMKLFCVVIVVSSLITMPSAFADNNQTAAQEVQKLAPGCDIFQAVTGYIANSNISYIAANVISGAGFTLRIYIRNSNKLQLFVDLPYSTPPDGALSIEISKKGIFELDLDGTGWYLHTKWRYQNGDFYLIGFTSYVYDYLDSQLGITQDVNISTLKEIETVESDKKVTSICSIPKSYQNIKLHSFSFDNFSYPNPYCSQGVAKLVKEAGN